MDATPTLSVPARLAAALAGTYRIERELGAGGMATVYLAQDLYPDGRRFLVMVPPAATSTAASPVASRLVVVSNWIAILRSRLGASAPR